MVIPCWKVGDGHSTLFWLDNWLGECPLARYFSRLYALAENKLITVSEMFSLRWGVGGEAWKWRRRLLAWEEELVVECVDCLSSVLLQEGVIDGLPTKDNLYKRGAIDTPQLSCATLCGKAEDRDHVFFQCEVYGRLWLLISK
ncbi:hypothetical protein TSUD_158120 [Trifolium subterraneum]|uniref:Reverse transcriptase zinc-binding domain-containing protein n=1 Tax=Trifolium subterraneum TaxID=3900 RepID=A0A2Z6MK96_TRISU|nr:hypothetical protein TSUD_158120 [Trifolium subterraneum]